MTTKAQKRATKKWKERNRVKIRLYNAEYCKKNRRKILAHKKLYREQHRAEINAKKREWYFLNRLYALQYAKKYHARLDKKMLALRTRKYIKTHPEYAKKKVVWNNNYYARKRASSFNKSVTPLAIVELFIKQGGVCAITGMRLDNDYHIDHIIPLSKGGKHSIENIQLVLPTVNLQKKDRLNFTRELVKI